MHVGTGTAQSIHGIINYVIAVFECLDLTQLFQMYYYRRIRLGKTVALASKSHFLFVQSAEAGG